MSLSDHGLSSFPVNLTICLVRGEMVEGRGGGYKWQSLII